MSHQKHNGDRRIAKRSKFSCEIEYVAAGISFQRTGILDNLSHTGALVWLRDRIDLGTDLVLIAQPERPEDRPIFIGAQVVRHVEDREDGMYGYGCIITSHSEEPF
jgi:hypothetical protein